MDPKQLLEQFLGSGTDGSATPAGGSGATPSALRGVGGLAGGLAAGRLIGLLVGNKKARKTVGKVAGGAIGLGGAAALGALAYRAYNNWQGSRTAALPGNGSAPAVGAASQPSGALPLEAPHEQAFAPGTAPASDGKPFELALMKAMVAAANADQHIDAAEQQAIFDNVEKLAIDADGKAFLFDALRNPPGLDDIVSLAQGPAQATEIYLASRLAIDPDHPAERDYLQSLARRLGLPDELVAELDRQVLAQDAVPA